MPRPIPRLDVRDTLLTAVVLATALTGCRQAVVAKPAVAKPVLSQPGIKLAYSFSLEDAVHHEIDRVALDLEHTLRDDKHLVDVRVDREGDRGLVVRTRSEADFAALDAALVAAHDAGLVDAGRAPAKHEARFRLSSERLLQLRQRALTESLETIRHRIDRIAVGPSVLGAGSEISVLLPGIETAQLDLIKRLLGRTARLEMRVVDDSTEYMRRVGALLAAKQKEFPGVALAADYWQTSSSGRDDRYVKSNDKAELERFLATVLKGNDVVPADHEIAFGRTPDGAWRTYYLLRRVELMGEHIAVAELERSDRAVTVSIQLAPEGARLLESLTTRSIGRKLAILLDGQIVSAPIVHSAITGGNARITLGDAADKQQMQQDAKELVAVLRSGALPAPLTLISETQTK